MARYRSSRGNGVIVACVIVAILLIISICLLIFLPKVGISINLPGNLIGNPENSVITLKELDEGADARFNVSNMFPGDSATKTYTVNVNHAGVEALSFVAEMGAVSQLETEKMNIRIGINGSKEALYEGPVVSMPERVRAEKDADEDQVKFDVTVSLDTSAGNDYQNKQIELWFHWWVDDTDYNPDAVQNEAPKKCVPWCWSMCPWCWVIPLLLAIALFFTIIIAIAWIVFRGRRRREAMLTGRRLGPGDLGLAALFAAMGIGGSIAINKLLDGKPEKKKRDPSDKYHRRGK
ncbi:MAG: hypothetical protein IKA05_00010 [Clostridia bacterium]|nr:hypothetical protein [Clostridia bacterium]